MPYTRGKRCGLHAVALLGLAGRHPEVIPLAGVLFGVEALLALLGCLRVARRLDSLAFRFLLLTSGRLLLLLLGRERLVVALDQAPIVRFLPQGDDIPGSGLAL